MSRTSAESELSEITRGECFVIRISSAKLRGAYSMLEVVAADPRNGVPMHVHDNEDEHFIVVEDKAFIGNVGTRVEVAAGVATRCCHACVLSNEHRPCR